MEGPSGWNLMSSIFINAVYGFYCPIGERERGRERVDMPSPPTARDASRYGLARTATMVCVIRNVAPIGSKTLRRH